jgi:SOS-response transcriptional repressor LexA
MAHPVARAADGAPVVARVGDRVMVRTLRRRGQSVVLLDGAGQAMELGPQDDYAVLGVLAAVIRAPMAQPPEGDAQ